jgi:hypothetical protein
MPIAIIGMPDNKGREPSYTEKLYRTISPSANIWAMKKAVNDFGWY